MTFLKQIYHYEYALQLKNNILEALWALYIR